MRPLAMDFRTDVRAQNIGDQFMFGPAVLVNPVTEPERRRGKSILPRAKWYDFWTGNARRRAARACDAAAPLERMPIYTCALDPSFPWGRKWNTQRKNPPTHWSCGYTPGADGNFTLYEDENDNYNYEKGLYATISLHWDDAKPHVDDRRAPGNISRNAGIAHVSCRCGARRPWSGNRADGASG